MNQSYYKRNQQQLQQLMLQAGIPDLQTLAKISGVSSWQLARLQHGLLYRMSVKTLLKLSNTLQISTEQLISIFVDSSKYPDNWQPQPNQPQSDFWQQEYQRLEEKSEKQKDTMEQKFQQASLQTLESWLIQWPTAIAAVCKNPDLPAARLLPIVKPIERLIKQWGIEKIDFVGKELPYNPQYHELMKGSAQPGDMVRVRYVGYKQKDRILYKPKVSLVIKE
ncbi:MAG: helix-turn-helix domain-containing protein [Xenococcaceae cyanobacterium MO_188.B19]|nr:helix-turn-helix domain-containing protein [Xenococcaceae cyanobacterium MO_188.B19]